MLFLTTLSSGLEIDNICGGREDNSYEAHSFEFNNGTLSGFVNDSMSNPIEGALIRVHFHGTYEEDYSDENGYYHVTNIPICYCMKNCTCSKEGYKTEWVEIGIVEDSTYDFVIYPLDVYPVLDGSRCNGWWNSPVTVTFVFDPEEVAEIWYDYYGWHLYTGPFVVDEGGDDIPIDYYWVNCEGEQSPITTFYLDIDQTPPVTDLTWLVHKVGFKWYVRFILTAEDAISGMSSPWLVIYINDLILGEFEVLDWPTAEFEIQWFKAFETVKFGFGCSDNACNFVIEEVNGSDIKSCPHSNILQISNNLLLRFFERFPLLQRLLDILGWYRS